MTPEPEEAVNDDAEPDQVLDQGCKYPSSNPAISVLNEVKGESHLDLYNTQDVANIFRVSTKTVMRWANSDKFQKHGVELLWTIGGHRRFRKSEINALFWKMIQDGKLD